jgi:hypothetical protein
LTQQTPHDGTTEPTKGIFMTRFLTTASLALALAAPLSAPAMAQMATPMMSEEDMANMIRTRDITGGPIYSMGTNYDANTWDSGYDDGSWDAVDWNADGFNQIGEIEDVVLDRQGQMVGLVAEVGGFLDIGDKHVVVPTDDLRLVPVDDRNYRYVTRLTEEQLEELPGVDEGFWD